MVEVRHRNRFSQISDLLFGWTSSKKRAVVLFCAIPGNLPSSAISLATGAVVWGHPQRPNGSAAAVTYSYVHSRLLQPITCRVDSDHDKSCSISTSLASQRPGQSSVRRAGAGRHDGANHLSDGCSSHVMAACLPSFSISRCSFEPAACTGFITAARGGTRNPLGPFAMFILHLNGMQIHRLLRQLTDPVSPNCFKQISLACLRQIG
jgi:hypothetical protein